MLLTPSLDRSYAVPSAPNTIILAPKASGDILDYTFDFTGWFGSTFDALVSPVTLIGNAVGNPYPVSLTTTQVAGKSLTVFLASGQPNSTNQLGLKITTQQGRQAVIPISLEITNVYPATLPPDGSAAGTTPDMDAIKTAVHSLIGTPDGAVGLSANGNITLNGVELFGVKNGRLYILAPLQEGDPQDTNQVYDNGGLLGRSVRFQ